MTLPSFEILKAVAKTYGISIDDLKGRRRTKDMAEARQLTAYFLRKINDLSYPAIGRILRKDHTTVIHSYNKISHVIEIKPEFKVFVERILGSFQKTTIVPDLNKSEPLTTDEIKYLSNSLSDTAARKRTSYRFTTSEEILKTNLDTEITEREADILSKYRIGMTLDEIALTVNVTRERVRQIVMHSLIKELGQKAKSGFKIDVQEYIDYQKDLHMKSRYLSGNRKQELESKIRNGANVSQLLMLYKIPREKFLELFPQYEEGIGLEIVKKKRWSRFYLKCRNCGTAAIRHHSHGLCVECYPKSDYFREVVRASNDRNYEKRKEHYRKYSKMYLKRPEVIAKMKRAWDLKYYGGNREVAIGNSGFMCIKCRVGREDAVKKYGKDLFVHHIDKDKNNNALSNLEALCYGCFKKIPKT